MTSYDNRSFDRETVELDGNEFADCTFENCTLIYRGGTLPKFSGNSIQQSTWNFQGAAELTLRFLTNLYHSGEGGKDLVERMFEQIRTGSILQGGPEPRPSA